jgi:hypothetical protein
LSLAPAKPSVRSGAQTKTNPTDTMPTSLSRTGSTHPLGKLTAKISEFRVSEETHDELERQAREAGLGLSEYVREVLMIRAHGVDMVRSLYERRLALVSGMSDECRGKS